MVRKLITSFLCMSLVTITTPSFAQGAKREKDAEISQHGPRRKMTTIVFAGLAGAVLGLSTLSFYGRPQDRLSNIAVGFAVGVITGTVYTTFQAATNPNDFYNLNDEQNMDSIAFASGGKDYGALGWEISEAQKIKEPTGSLPTLNYVFQF